MPSVSGSGPRSTSSFSSASCAGVKGLEAALASLWSDIPVQRCTVHKERNLLAHAPKALHDEVKADFTDMMYAENAKEVRKKRKAFLARRRLIPKVLDNNL